MRSNPRLRLGVLALCGLFAGQSATASIIIDKLNIFQNIQVPEAGPTATKGSSAVLDNGSDTFLGPDREFYVQRQSSTPSFNDVSMRAGFGALAYNSSELTQGRAKIVYDGVAGDSIISNFNDHPDNYLLGLNLTNFYKVTVVASTDNKSLPFTVTLYRSNSVYMTQTITLQTTNPLLRNTYSIYFNAFTPTGGSVGSILSNVNAVAVAFNSDYSGQVGADSTVAFLEFTQVPEPINLALAGSGLLAIATVRRRNR